MPRKHPEVRDLRGQLPKPLRLLIRGKSEQVTPDDYDAILLYLDGLVGALDNTRHFYHPKVGVGLTNAQATTTALAAVSWETQIYGNGGIWNVSAPTRFPAVVSGVYHGVFQTKIDAAGSIRVQLAINGTDEEFGMNVTLAGDLTFAFPWQMYLNVDDYVQIKVSTSSSANLVAAWTKAYMIHADYLEEV